MESLHSCSSWCHVVGPSAGTLTLRSSCYVLPGQRQYYLPIVDFLSQEIEERWAVPALKVPHLDLFDPLFQG